MMAFAKTTMTPVLAIEASASAFREIDQIRENHAGDAKTIRRIARKAMTAKIAMLAFLTVVLP